MVDSSLTSPLFTACFALVVGTEGGYTSGEGDPGGETKYGISKRSYPSLDIKNLTLAQAQAIYFSDFWTKCGVDTILASGGTSALAYYVFDSAINNGDGGAAENLQRALNYLGAHPALAVDGDIGPITRAAIKSVLSYAGSSPRLEAEFNAQRMNAMASLSTWPTFGLGWSRRLAELPYNARTLPNA